jgi:TPR repeat protein
LNSRQLNFAVVALILLFASVLCVWLFIAHQKPDNAFIAVSKGQYPRAVEFLNEGVVAGDPNSATSLANLYRLGLGLPKDNQKAIQLYSFSAHSGDVNGMVNLALMYREGLGVKADAEIAYAWLNLARDKHSKVAQLYMSEMLAEHELSAHLVPQIKKRYSTIENMPEPEQALQR